MDPILPKGGSTNTGQGGNGNGNGNSGNGGQGQGNGKGNGKEKNPKPKEEKVVKDTKRSALWATQSRHIRPEHGRFFRQDPGGMIDGLNRYRWLRNNPNRYADPNGQFAVPVIGALAAWRAIGALAGGVQAYRASASAGDSGYGLAADTLLGGVGGAFLPEIATLASTHTTAFVVGGIGTQLAFKAANAGLRRVGLSEESIKNVNRVASACFLAAGVKAKISSRNARLRQIADKARTQRDTLARSFPNNNKRGVRPAKVTAAYDEVTGDVATGCSGGGPCAEQVAYNELLSRGSKPQNIRFVETVVPRGYPRPLKVADICIDCEVEFGRTRFPKDTVYSGRVQRRKK